MVECNFLLLIGLHTLNQIFYANAVHMHFLTFYFHQGFHHVLKRCRRSEERHLIKVDKLNTFSGGKCTIFRFETPLICASLELEVVLICETLPEME